MERLILPAEVTVRDAFVRSGNQTLRYASFATAFSLLFCGCGEARPINQKPAFYTVEEEKIIDEFKKDESRKVNESKKTSGKVRGWRNDTTKHLVKLDVIKASNSELAVL